MSKLDLILEETTFTDWELDCDTDRLKQEIKDLLQKLIEETFDKNDTKAYEFWKKVEAL